ncbi:MAG: S1/P1 nuclease [Pseudomonadales bacterium]|nr:S1/P1 nuclease [Pseudomonadales bacterium]
MFSRLFIILFLRSLLASVLLFSPASSLAWDAAAHRLSAYLVHDSLQTRQRDRLDQILQHHPRYQQDFLDQMPDWLRSESATEQQRWRLGQAAVWPDLARGLPRALAAEFNHPDWHWLDGHWMPATSGASLAIDGNVYLGREPLAQLLDREPQNSLRAPGNIMQALSAMQRQLLDTDMAMADRAVALCWVLHLIADLHQPLHSGALFSAQRFVTGDRGGNLIKTNLGNLHAVWDQALRGERFTQQLQSLQRIQSAQTNSQETIPADWLMESRQLLHEQVYTELVRAHVQRHERSAELPELQLPDNYLDTMRRIARERVALSASRMNTFLRQLQ